jgi:hypothetical protein
MKFKKAFIDGTYEGDLVAATGAVPTMVGRESNVTWQESLAGVTLCSSGYESFGGLVVR